MSTLSLLLLAAAVALPARASPAIDELDWLAGHWCGENRGTFNEEVWLAPRAGSLVGMHRDSRDGALKGFEFFRIVADGDRLVYWTQPGGRAAIAFHARSAADGRVDFINPDHDFPKRIRYRRVDSTTLHARIDDGTDTGPSMEWIWTLDCDAAR